MTSKALEKFLSSYGGINDPHLRLLKMIKDKYAVERVLYPGSWIHLTPSLIFPSVVYVDFFAKMESMFKDQELLFKFVKDAKVLTQYIGDKEFNRIDKIKLDLNKAKSKLEDIKKGRFNDFIPLRTNQKNYVEINNLIVSALIK